jgi:hypothetical protein
MTLKWESFPDESWSSWYSATTFDQDFLVISTLV